MPGAKLDACGRSSASSHWTLNRHPPRHHHPTTYIAHITSSTPTKLVLQTRTITAPQPNIEEIPQPTTSATMVTQFPAFKTATTDSRKLKAKPNNDELLEVNPPRLCTADHLHLPRGRNTSLWTSHFAN